MPTELLTLASQQTLPAGRESPLRGIRSSQAPTVRHDDLSFGDFVDMINPLHHIPIVSSLYQNASGDTISPVASLIGGGLLGGIIGFVGAAVNAVFQEATGEGLVSSLASAVMGETETGATATALAARQSASRFYVKPSADQPTGESPVDSLDMRV